MVRRIVSQLLAVVMLLAIGREALAQSSTLSGKVTDSDKNVPVAGANVQVVTGLTVAAKTVTGDDGSYRVTGLTDGTYAVVITKIGYSARRNEGVVVRGATTSDFTMVEAAYRLATTVVTTNRGATPQKELDIPASIAVITSESFENKPSPTMASIIKNVPGVSVSQGGLMQSNIVSRGFNNAFSGSMLNLQDYRFAGVPSLRVNVPSLFTGTQDDIARIEVLNGPASSLYGPNSANGVLHILTKSPFESQGTTLSLDGGQQSLFRVAGRHAGVFGAAKAWGYKVSGEYFSAEDFKYTDPNEPATFPNSAPTPAARRGKPNNRDFALRRTSAEARLDYKPNPDLENITTVGYSQLGSGIELTTAFGAAYGKNWSYMNFQDRFKYKNFFAQIFWNGNNSGNKDSTDLNGTYYLRTGIPVVDKSNVLVGQVQQAYNLFDWKLVGGLDYIATKPRSEGTIFGRNEGNTDITEMGAYIQGAYPLSPSVELTTALRADQNNRMDGVQFSPRIATTWKKDASNTFRASFARAFNSPASFSFFLDQISNPTAAPGFALRAVGNPPKEGWKFNRSCDATINTGICMRSPFTAPGTISSSSANAFPGFITALSTIAAGLPDAAFGGAAQKAGFLAVYNNVARPSLAAGAAPTTAQINTVLRMGSTVVPAANVADLRPLMPSFNNTWEVGYKGILRDRVRLAVDLWYQVRGDVGAPIGQLNPLVFYDPATLGGFLGARLQTPLGQFFSSPQGGGLSGAALQTAVTSYITSLTTVMAQLPQGSLALTNAILAPDQSIIATYSSGVGSIDVRGLDMAIDWQVSDRWMLAGSYSNQDKIVWNEIGGAANPLMSNSAKHRASLSVKNSNDATGFSWELGMRYSDKFPVNSGVFNSLNPSPVQGAKIYDAVPVQTLFDFNAAWRLPIESRVTWSINIQNINDQKLPTFPGGAPIGRLAMTRLQWWF
jgi:outer membrane receptor for ferrienterochelin and colicins